MPNDLESTAADACASIVKHYSDPIHFASSLTSGERDGGSDQNSYSGSAATKCLDKSAPYFDTILGGPMPDLAPVCDFWYRKLLDASASSTSLGASLIAARELLCSYESIIHPCVKRQRNRHDEDSKLEKEVSLNAVVEIIINYELLLAHLMRDASTQSVAKDDIITEENEPSNPIIETGTIVLRGAEDTSKTIEENKSELDKMVCVIADDIFHWSANLPKKDKASMWKIQNILLPCLLRLIQHTIVLPTYRQHEKLMTNNTQLRNALAVATVTAVAFVGDGKLNSGDFGIGSLLEWTLDIETEDCHENAPTMPSHLSLAHTLQSCSLSPISTAVDFNATCKLPMSIVSSDFMTRPVVDWSVPSAHFDAPWTDGVAGVGSRVAMALIRTVQQSSGHFVPSNVKDADVDSCSDKISTSLPLLLREISQNVGVDLLVSTVRTHFFGRLGHSCSSDANVMVQPQARGVFMPMVQRIGSNISKKSTATASSSGDEKPHVDIPMRLSAAAIILCAALRRPCNNFETWDKAISDALPIVLSLLDDVQSIHQATGALMFVSIIEAASTFEESAIPSFVDKFGQLITSSLESAIQMCGRGEPTVLTILCLAQSKWIGYLGLISRYRRASITPQEIHSMARKAASDMLVIIRMQAQTGGRDGNDERISGALAAGINPLLARLATFSEAASVEIARIGLSALLPVIGWSGMSLDIRSAQVAALAGLISLMNGAYPIMPHHGKKVMTEVLLLLDRADKDAIFLSNEDRADATNGQNDDMLVSTNVVSYVALYTAAFCLAICGNGAESVLGHIESTQSRKELLSRCLEIRTASEQLGRR